MFVQYVGALVGGLFFFSLIEYVHHRVGGHSKRLGTKMRKKHLDHHRDPQEGGVKLITKYRGRASLVAMCLVPILLISSLVFGVILGVFFATGALGGYLYSEWYHHRMHHRTPRTRLGAWLRRYHFIHHYKNPKANFGFTQPFWDLLFRSGDFSKTVMLPPNQVPKDLDPGMGFVMKKVLVT